MQSYPQGPYAPPQYQGPVWGPKPKSSKAWLFILLGVVVLAVGGCTGLVAVGVSMVEDEVTVAMGKHPAVTAELGNVEKCSMSLARTWGDARQDYFHYECKGSKATGRAILHTEATGPSGQEEIVDGQLEVSGKTIKLKPSS